MSSSPNKGGRDGLNITPPADLAKQEPVLCLAVQKEKRCSVVALPAGPSPSLNSILQEE